MTISVGERVPDATLKMVTPDGIKPITTAELFSGQKVVLFGVPGAFTPTCSNTHLPGFLENFDAITARGVDRVAVVSVNDHHVMTAWARFTGGEGKLTYLADGNGDFVRSLGLDIDLSAAGMGTRSRRFSAVVEDGVVTQINEGDEPGKAEISGAARILEQI